MVLVACALHAVNPTKAAEPQRSFRGSPNGNCVVFQYEAFGRMVVFSAASRAIVAAPTAFVKINLTMHGIHPSCAGADSRAAANEFYIFKHTVYMCQLGLLAKRTIGVFKCRWNAKS
jgi:hypothetical protein